MLNDVDNSLQFWSAAMRQIQLPIGFGPAIYEKYDVYGCSSDADPGDKQAYTL